MESMHSILIASMTLFAASTWIDARVLTGTKSQYTEAHHALHRLVRSTTHSHLEDFEIAVPELVDVDGDLHSRSRARHSFAPLPILKLTAHGHDFRVELEENDLLLAPGFTVKRIRRDAATGELREHEQISDGAKCHYTGRMISHENKITGISTCGNGVSGFLRTTKDDFVIEPVSPDLPHNFPGEQRPHVVYKRKHMGNGKRKLHYCGKRKRHPTTISHNLDDQIRQFSNGAIVLQSPERAKYETEARRGEHGGGPALFGRPKRSSDAFSAATRGHGRRKVVETLVVADRQLIKNHESDRVDVATYILTVMNMATSLFKDGTLDGNIDIVLIGVTMLEDDEELGLDHRADQSLSNFCRWQSTANTTTGRRPDHSILLTGIDICIDRNVPCDTLGLAQIGGMCGRSNSCTVNEDMGLGLAFTVAHETGHSFGMKHDGQDNSCSKREGHIMSPTMNNLNGVFTWSSCSRNALRQFLKSDRANCLDDAPAASRYAPNHKLPGETYNPRDQCQMQFGKGVTVCHFRHFGSQQKSICKALWCQRSNGVCETKSMPAVEGTSCGRNMWCRRGECVSRRSSGPRAVVGGWSKFGPWSGCSRTCGVGIKSRKRSCNSPVPRHGGRYCDGDDTNHVICNAEDCPPSALDFRAQQCAEYNGLQYRKQFFNWVPYKKYWKHDLNKCELLCEADGYNFFDRLAPRVKDGTSCDDESNDICVSGRCVRVGCDSVIGSNATLDSCGVCNGNNSTCRFVRGKFRDLVSDSGYYEVVKIPQGASSIQITEIECCTHTYIAVKSANDHSRYYLNGNWRIDLYGEIKFAGAKWQYKRESLRGEVLTADGPIDEDLIVEVLIVRRNPGISFSYAVRELDNTLPHNTLAPVFSYSWKQERSNCSKLCAGGQQNVTYVCMGDGRLKVVDSFCRSPKPEVQKLTCNTDPCPARWVVAEWGKCSRTCGGGRQRRRVTCKSLSSSGKPYVSSHQCDSKDKPKRSQMCSKDECPPMWEAGPWSKCSKLCRSEFRTRTVSCRSETQKLHESKCDPISKPHSRSTCPVSSCRRKFQWFIAAWSKCSAGCGLGRQTRRLKCTFRTRSGRYKPVNRRRCRHTSRPKISLSKPCTQKACPATTAQSILTLPPIPASHQTTTISRLTVTKQLSSSRHVTPHEGKVISQPAEWVADHWSQCAVTCGGARQVRFVSCISGGVTFGACADEKKPVSERMCNTNACPAIPDRDGAPCEDRHTWCHMVPQHHQCSHKFFGPPCCKSCKDPPP